MIGMLSRLRSRLSSAYLPEPSLQSAPILGPDGRPANITRGSTLSDIMHGQFAITGIAPKHLREFAANWRMGRWNARHQMDFWGPQYAQMSDSPFGPLSGVIPASAVKMPDFAAFQAELNKVNEVLRWGLYDRLAYATGGQFTLTFFQQTLNVGYQFTNMLSAGQLPGNQSQLVMGIRVGPEPSVTDVSSGVAFAQWYNAWIGKNWLEFEISTKNYLRESPIAKLAPGYGWIGTPGLTNAGAGLQIAPSLGQSGTPDRNAIWNLNIPLGILPNRAFKVTLNWNPVAAVTTAGTAVVELDGLMLRAAQ